MKIGTIIKEKRTKSGLTQEDLAKKLHVSRSTISNWEINRN
ncbi:helix-turn-helix transcriptional regulator [Mogibacterium diversum]|nr:helix-turn-helix transcriptional regulator [Mogibacterium diversum]